MHEIRKSSYTQVIDRHIELVGDYTIRDEKSVNRIAAGLLKLLIPGESTSRSDLKAIMDMAIEYRQRANDWLHILSPGEFSKKNLAYDLRPSSA